MTPRLGYPVCEALGSPIQATAGESTQPVHQVPQQRGDDPGRSARPEIGSVGPRPPPGRPGGGGSNQRGERHEYVRPRCLRPVASRNTAWSSWHSTHLTTDRTRTARAVKWSRSGVVAAVAPINRPGERDHPGVGQAMAIAAAARAR